MLYPASRTINIIFLALLFSLSGFFTIAQSTQSVNIIFSGINNTTKNYKVTLAGKSFYSNKDYNNSDNDVNIASVDDLKAQKYTIKLYRLSNNNAKYNTSSKKTLVYTKAFDLREGYDMDITISASGHVEFSENATPAEETGSNNKAPMADVKFTSLLQSVRSKFSQALKGETLSDAFNNSNNYFTTSQVRQLLGLITSESDRVELAKLSYHSITDSANFIQLYDLFKAKANRDELNDFLRSKGWNTSGDSSIKLPMAELKFNALLQNVRNKFSQALKGETESEAFTNSNNYFSTSQIRQLLNLIAAENDKVDLAKLSYRAVTDSANFTQLYDLFKTQGAKNEFNDFLRSKGWNIDNISSSIKTPMTDVKFNTLLQTVQGKWSQALKGETESDAFNNPGNYFRTQQVKQLLTLITSENDRLDLAKLSYRSVTDSANFTQLYDLFQIQASREELNDFLRNRGWNNTTNLPAAKTPVSDQDFDQLLTNVRFNVVQFLKIGYETEVFNNVNYYFTTNQIRQLLLLINAENSRLELAKLSYKTVTDPANFLQLNNLFTSQSSRDQLANFVKTH